MSQAINHRLQHSILLSLILVLYPVAVFSDTFTTDFEAVPDQVDPTTTSTVTNNGLSADFTGGTIDTIGVGALYSSGVKSWMVAPAGDTAPLATAVSTGTGTITLSDVAENVQVSGRNESSATVAEVRLIDENGMMINSAISLTDTAWTDIDVSRLQGQSMITSIQLVILSGSGTGMAALDDLSYETPLPATAPPTISSSSGSMSMVLLFAVLMLMMLRTHLLNKQLFLRDE